MHFDKNSQRTYASLSMILYFYLSYKIFAIKNLTLLNLFLGYILFITQHTPVKLLTMFFTPLKRLLIQSCDSRYKSK